MIKRQDLSESMIVIEMQYDHYYSLERIMLDSIQQNTDKYGLHVGTCVMSANYFDVLGKGGQEISNIFGLGANFCRANFMSFFGMPGEKSFEYLGKTYEFGSSDNLPSFIDPKSWMEGFHASVLSRSENVTDFLCTVDPANHYGGGVSMSEVYHKHVAILKAVFSGDDSTNERIHEFLEIFENPQNEDASLDLKDNYNKVFFPMIFVPVVELYDCILNHGGDGFNEKFESAVQMHKEFWTDEDRLYDGMGWLSLPLLTVAIFAESKGVSVTIDSEYTPQWLIKGDFSDVSK